MGPPARHRSRYAPKLAATVALLVPLAPMTQHRHHVVLEPASVQKIDFAGAPLGQPWPDDTTYGAWYSLHNGFGLTQVELQGSTRVLRMATRAATSPGETYSSLVRTQRSFADVDFTERLTTLAQLRTPVPNPWEVAWVLWHYTDNSHFYSFIVKPDGWELSKEDPAYPGAQRFLAYSYATSFPVGPTYAVRVKQVGSTITVWVNGVRIVRFVDKERPYLSGSIALYAEDSSVSYEPVELASATASP